MGRLEIKKVRGERAKRSLKKKIRGTADRPRLVVFRSITGARYADDRGHIIANLAFAVFASESWL